MGTLALTAGFIANGGYCFYLLFKRHTWGLFNKNGLSSFHWIGAALMGFAWISGTTLYGISASTLGNLGAVVGWPLFMAMIIITANLWATGTGEWR